LAAREHDFLTSDLSDCALQARGMGLSTPDFMRQCLRQEWARFFEHIDVVLCSPAPTGPIRHDQKPDPHARSIEVNGNQRPYFELMLWACLAIGAGLPAAAAPAMLGADGLPRGVQIVAASFEDRTAVACAAMLDALGASFSPADGLSAMARLTSNAANACCKLGELA
jgi:amidase